MGQLVFQAALGGQVNLVGPNTASTFNLNVPAASDTLVARATTDTLTNKTLTSPVISGGTIDNAVIGGTTAVAGSFTTVTAGTSVTTPFVTSAAATNLLLKSAGTTAITIDTSQNVGVGTTPSYKLDVNSLSASNVIGRFTNNSGYYTYLLSSGATSVFSADTSGNNSFTIRGASNQLELYTNGSLRSTLDSSGNLGLGVTPSAWGLGKAIEMSQSGNSLWASGSANDIRLTANAYYNGTNYKYGATNYANMYIVGSGTGQHQWYNAASGTAGNAITFIQAMTLDASGNLGIGTSSPSGRLDVVTASGSTYINARRNSQSSGEVGLNLYGGTSGQNWGIYIPQSSNDLRFYTNGVDRVSIDSSGNLLVGTTSIFASGKECIAFNGSANAGISLKETTAGAGTFANFVNSSGSIIGQINQNGASNVSYVTSSDYRLKENIAPMTGALQTISQLKPCTYTWKLDGSAGQGFIAHELQEVVPDAVCGEKDAVNEDGSIKPQGIDTSFLVATLTAAIKEQQALIVSMRDELDALKAKVGA